MKKLTFLLSAVALLGLASCTEPMEVNPNYNAETNEVTANFVFNVSTNGSPATKSLKAAVQDGISNATDFRGIDNSFLAAYALKDGSTLKDGNHLADSTLAAQKVYSMGQVMSAGFIDGTNKTHRILEMSVPAETNTMLFWGKAIRTASDVKSKNEYGYVAWPATSDFEALSNAQKLKDLKFSLTPRIENTESFEQYQAMLAAIMTIATDAYYDSGSDVVTWNGQSTSGPVKIAWRDFATFKTETQTRNLKVSESSPLDETLPMCALGEIMGNAYASLCTVYYNSDTDQESRAGSGEAVYYQLRDIYRTLHDKVMAATPISLQEQVAWNCAQAYVTALERILDITNNRFQTISTLKSNIHGYVASDGTKPFETLNMDKVTTDRLRNFPQITHGLPHGTALLSVANTKVNRMSGGGNIMHPKSVWSYRSTNPTSYAYTPELCYFGNSPLRVSDVEHVPTDYPEGVSNWDGTNDGQSGGGSGTWSADWVANSHVTSSTRSVAMQENINYGTALLESKVMIDSEKSKDGSKAIFDNNAAIQLQHEGVTTEADNLIVPNFSLTGIIVADVAKDVDWHYIPVGTDAMFVYDSLGVVAIPNDGNTCAAQYTLMWDNFNWGETQKDVKVVLEFRNNSEDEGFWGKDNFIRAGGTFYIAATLKPANATNKADILWPGTGAGTTGSPYALPPYKYTETGYPTLQTPRVFMQDYKTTVTFRIGETSLHHAYVTVPDLRSSGLTFGLSVDLAWQTGLSFDVVLGS